MSTTTTTTQLVPVYKFYSTEPWRFFYSTNRDDAAIRAGWTRAEDMAFYAYKTQVPGTIAINRFVAPNPTRYQYSTQVQAAGPGWKNEGPAFYAFPASTRPRAGIMGVIQYHAVGRDGGWRYQYSVDATNPGLQGWTKGNIAFYVPTVEGCSA
jgi:hypothetical protein